MKQTLVLRLVSATLMPMSFAQRASTIPPPDIHLTGNTLIRACVRREDGDSSQRQTQRFHNLIQDAIRTLPSEYVIAHNDDQGLLELRVPSDIVAETLQQLSTQGLPNGQSGWSVATLRERASS